MALICPDRRDRSHFDGRTNAARGAKASARRRGGCCAAPAVQVDADRQLLRTDQEQQSVIDGPLQPAQAGEWVVVGQDLRGPVMPLMADLYAYPWLALEIRPARPVLVGSDGSPAAIRSAPGRGGPP